MIKLIFGFLGFVLAIGVFVFLSYYFESLYDDAEAGSIKESLYRAISITSTIIIAFLIVFTVAFVAVTILGMYK